MVTDLVVPGLLNHLPRLEELGELPRFPNLELLLSRGRRFASPQGYPETLFHLYDVEVPPGVDVPTAAVCFLAEANAEEQSRGFLMHADPVHLRPDQDRLLAFDFYHQPLTDNEASQFADAFNRHFAADGLHLLTPHANRWYLVAEGVPRIHTRPLSEVIGRNIDLFLPDGEDATTWRGWLNELQMLFFALPVNQTRESVGQLPVSGLWFSGGGVVPSGDWLGYTQIEGGSVLEEGLQRGSVRKRHRRLVVEHAPGRAVIDADPATWVEALTGLETLLATSLAGECYLFPCDGRAWHWRPTMRHHLWKRIKRLTCWLRA